MVVAYHPPNVRVNLPFQQSSRLQTVTCKPAMDLETTSHLGVEPKTTRGDHWSSAMRGSVGVRRVQSVREIGRCRGGSQRFAAQLAQAVVRSTHASDKSINMRSAPPFGACGAEQRWTGAPLAWPAHWARCWAWARDRSRSAPPRRCPWRTICSSSAAWWTKRRHWGLLAQPPPPRGPAWRGLQGQRRRRPGRGARSRDARCAGARHSAPPPRPVSSSHRAVRGARASSTASRSCAQMP
mmetsp:Transcript_13496/g.36026  ORF Transcript_13496/g.36026 Transcript_13496/m.36026 type:complete len:239 (+) Transcript_13496:179-895(+)